MTARAMSQPYPRQTMGINDRERQLLAERDRVLDRLAELNLERRELQDRLTLIEIELGL